MQGTNAPTRTMLDRILHAYCEADVHDGAEPCVCPTRRQKEADARGTGPIPEKDPAIEKEFTRMRSDDLDTHGTELAEWLHSRPNLPCRSNPAVFHGPGNKGPVGSDLAEAQRLCGLCLYTDTCLTVAMRQKDRHAYVGGTTPEDRRRINVWRTGRVA